MKQDINQAYAEYEKRLKLERYLKQHGYQEKPKPKNINKSVIR